MFVAINSIFSVVACLRFEIAIPIPEDDRVAIDLVFLSLLSVLILTLLFFLVIFFFFENVNEWTDFTLNAYLWMLPLGFLFSGFYAVFQYWATRRKEFPAVAKTRVMQAISGAGAQVGLGLLGAAPIGLLIGQIIQSGAGMVVLGKKFVVDTSNQLTSVNVSSLKYTFKYFDRFPKYSTWEALTNSTGIQLPIIIIAGYALGAEAGYIMLAMKLLSAPMNLIGRAVAQVYLSEAPQKYQLGVLREFTLKTIWTLFKLGFFPVLIVSVLAPWFVPIVFGEIWARAGILTSWMAPWFLMQFVVSPVSMVLNITNSLKVAVILQVFGMVFRAGLVLMAAIYCNDYVGEIYAVSGVLFYVLYLMVVMRIVK